MSHEERQRVTGRTYLQCYLSPEATALLDELAAMPEVGSKTAAVERAIGDSAAKWLRKKKKT